MASVKALAAIALTLIVAVPIAAGYVFSLGDVEYDEWQSESSINLSQNILNYSTQFYGDYTGTTNNTILQSPYKMVYVNTGTNPTSYPAMTLDTHSISFTANVYVDLSSYDYWTVEVPTTLSASKTEGSWFTSGMIGSTWVISGNGGKLALSQSYTATLTSYDSDGTYANVSYGWKLPTTNSVFWENGQTNNATTFIIDLPDDSLVSLGSVHIENVGGVVSVWRTYGSMATPTEHVTLGTYRYLVLDYTRNTPQVSGISSWPVFGGAIERQNTTTITTPTTYAEDYTYLGMSVTNTDTIFRVDRASALSGTFPSTKNYTLDIGGLYPGKSYDLKLNSIGVYGDSINLGSQAFGVSMGRINVNGHLVPLKGAVIQSHLEDGVYVNTINNMQLADSSEPMQIYFGGEWSLTVTGDLMEKVHGTRTEWIPGQFAFDKQDMAAVGLMVAGACVVGLGFYGARSGIKIGVLLLICGGAALVYLTFI